MALCECACGGVCVVRVESLRSGNTRSCGCLVRERARSANITHGDTPKGDHSPEYRTWSHFKGRCLNPKDRSYPDYGGRGITVCERWLSYENFLEDMGRRPSAKHTLDRVDNSGNYEPGNCRWATRKEQANNRRVAKTARWLTHPVTGERRIFAEWVRVLGVPSSTLANRIARGWPLDRVLSR